MEIANTHGNKSFELRASMDFARLGNNKKWANKARKLLKIVIESIGEGDSEPYRSAAQSILQSKV